MYNWLLEFIFLNVGLIAFVPKEGWNGNWAPKLCLCTSYLQFQMYSYLLAFDSPNLFFVFSFFWLWCWIVYQQIDCIHNNAVMEVMRGLRSQLSELITGLAGQELGPMSLGLSHSLSRYKLKFSPDKVIIFYAF